MTWVIVALLMGILAQLGLIASAITRLQRTVISASDLNLEAHKRLLAHFENVERERNRPNLLDYD